MRYSEGHKEAVRARIVEAASRAVRREGLGGVSIAGLMKQVGLTHGGFYAHFRDREELVAEALRFAGSETTQRIFGSGSRVTMLDRYLTKEHVDHRELGCVLAALATEAPAQGAPIKRTFAELARTFVRHVETTLHPDAEPGELSDDALATAARMIGAVILARLVRDDALASRILAAARADAPKARAR